MQVPRSSPSAPDNDADDVARARQGSFEAFERLVARHEQALYGLAMRISRHAADAEDIVQQTFLSVLEHLNQFEAAGTFRAWLLKIGANHALKILRKRRGLPVQHTDIGDNDEGTIPHPQFIAPWREDPVEIAQRAEAQQLVSQALDELDDKYRLVFILRDIEQFSTEETAAALGISSANVKVRLLRARLTLRERLTATLGDPGQRLQAGHAGEKS